MEQMTTIPGATTFPLEPPQKNFFMVFGWFPWFFREVSWFFMVFYWFPWFFKVVSWFLWIMVGFDGFVG